ncbi:RHS repeat-associated core domain-containing protein [Streptomyces mutabilis]|uniref:RHS repeat-associated core domain-containing protein n=1 Tax=Streptomyces mutabilis TaxID=67332 RepID=UPI003985CCEE
MPRTTPTEAVPQPYRYAGAYADPTGLYKMGHRYYDPTLSRFTQPDPSGQETNPYLYAAGDPVNRTDPTGLFSFSDILDTGSKFFGVVSGCVSGIGAAASTGTIRYAAAVGGVVGAGGGTRSAPVPSWSAVVRWEASRATTEPTSSPTDDVQSDANQTIYRGVT